MQLEAAHDIARRLGSATWIRWTGAPAAIGLARAGQHARATSLLDEVDDAVGSRATPAAHARRALRCDRARGGCAGGGRAEEALRTIEMLDVAGTPRAAYSRAQALRALGRWSEAAEMLHIARGDALVQGARPLLWRLDAAQGHVHLGERRRLDARRCFDAARAQVAELALELDDAKLAATFQAGADAMAPPPAERTAAQAAKDAHGGLTRRERDTAALIVQGKSNRAIARALGIGERTVEGYVASALAKLGVSSRAQIAVWAAEQGLGGNERSHP